MFGKNLFGVSLFGASDFLTVYSPTEEFSFDTYGLQNPTQYGIHITDYTIQTPTRDFSTANVPGGHGRILLEDWYRVNEVQLTGWVSAPTREDLEAKIHEMLRNIHKQGGSLFIKDAGNYKEIRTTLQSAVFENKHYSITKKKFVLTFSGIKSFWRDLLYSSQFYAGNSAMTMNGNMDNRGSIIAEPIVLIVFNSATDITAISLQNTLTGELVSIDTAIIAGDVIVFDSETKTVKKNNVEFEFSGKLPSLRVGLNSFTIALTGTSANYDVTAKHKNSYLTA